MAELVRIRLAADRHPELVGIGPVELHALTRLANLREEYLDVRPVLAAPMGNPAPECPQCPGIDSPGPLPQQLLEQLLGLQARIVMELTLRLVPDRLHGVLPRPPRVRL